MDLNLHLPGPLQGKQYQYDRHIQRPIEGIINAVLPMMPALAGVITMREIIERIPSRLVEVRKVSE